MEPNKTFNDVLKTIETSNLNYSMTKTPFSARVSIKSSFVNRFVEVPQFANNKTIEKEKESEEIKQLKAENLKLKEELKIKNEAAETDNKVFIVKQENMENLFEQEKAKSKKALDQQISDFREELLKIKSQRNNLNSKLKNLEAESTNAREELKIVKAENEAFKSRLKEKEKVLSKKNNELKTSQTEKENLRELAAGVKQE